MEDKKLQLNKNFEIKEVTANKELIEDAAKWFSSKWGIDYALYVESMKEGCNLNNIPKWYVVFNAEKKIIAGAGVIQNDFHKRKDLYPNLCAVYVEEAYRNLGIAKFLLNYIPNDVKKYGYKRIYLVTDHLNFYEKCGWNFLCMVNDFEDVPTRMYYFDIKNEE